MNNKKAKLLKKIVYTAEPDEKILARNMYRYIKRCYTRQIHPIEIPNYLFYYNNKINRINVAIKKKLKRLTGVKDDITPDPRVL